MNNHMFKGDLSPAIHLNSKPKVVEATSTSQLRTKLEQMNDPKIIVMGNIHQNLFVELDRDPALG